MLYIAAYLASIVAMIAAVRRMPALILRPSIWFACAMTVQINGAAAFSRDDAFAGIADAGTFRGLLLAFPLLSLAWAVATPRLNDLAQQLNECSGRDCGLSVDNVRLQWRVLVGALLASAFIVAAYLSKVPLRSTGLYVMLTNPIEGMIAREMSFKLVESAWVRYLYGAHCFVVAPIASALLVQARFRWNSGLGLARFAILGLLLMSVMLTGARVAGGALIVVLGVVALLRYGVLRGARFLGASVVALLIIATLLTVQRDGAGEELDAGMFVEYLSGAILRRTVVVPLETGIWTNALAQSQGAFGVAGIRPLALAFGEQYVNVANVVGLNYMINPYSTVSAVTSTVFDYQAAFGYWKGWAASLALICSLDYFLYCFARLRGPVLVAMLASFLVAELALISSTFTTVLLSHGMLPIAVVGLMLGARARSDVNRNWGSPTSEP